MLLGDIFLQAHNEQQRCGTHNYNTLKTIKWEPENDYLQHLLISYNLLDGHIRNVHAISCSCDVEYVYIDTSYVHANKMLYNHKPQKCTNCMHKKKVILNFLHNSRTAYSLREQRLQRSKVPFTGSFEAYVYFTISDVVWGENSCFGCTLSGCFYTNTGKNVLTSAFGWLAEDWRFVCFIHEIIEYVWKDNEKYATLYSSS